MTGGNGRHPLPDPERLAQRLGDIGIGADPGRRL
jgi:thiosulfate/3-mercaptopyruvate sulfurtransferase